MDSVGGRCSGRFLLKLPALVLAAGIWYLSSLPVLPKPVGLLGFDKFQHFLAYCALAAAIALWFSREKWRRSGFGLPALTAALASIYGLIDEIHQYFVPGRNCDAGDWISDTLGALAAAAAVKLALGRRKGIFIKTETGDFNRE
ncbi:MAG: VanZ family protein, partial [Treponema sp.]|nr:VanZ family protein [Treponema sp.]